MKKKKTKKDDDKIGHLSEPVANLATNTQRERE